MRLLPSREPHSAVMIASIGHLSAAKRTLVWARRVKPPPADVYAVALDELGVVIQANEAGVVRITTTARRVANAHNCCGTAEWWPARVRLRGPWRVVLGPLSAASGDRLPGRTRPGQRPRRTGVAGQA
jgi:hypothetical protein